MAQKVIVVGAGPGGLAAAMLLAAQGYDVVVYEEKDRVGGRNARLSLGDYHFDTGPTFLMMLEVLQDIFTRTGRQLNDYVTLHTIDPLYRLSFNRGEREFMPSRDRQRMKEAMEAFAPGSYEGYLKYREKENEKYDKLIPCLRVPYNGLKDFMSWKFVTALPYLDAHVSLYDVLSRYFSDELTKIAFTFQAKYIGMSPWEAPGTFSILSFIEHGGGIYHVEGGLNRISDAMSKVLQEDGGTIHLDTKVKQLVVEGGVARGVLLENGETDRADYVVLNADFAHAMTNIVKPAHRKKYTDKKIASFKYSCSTFMVYLGLDTIYEDQPHHNILFADDYKKNVEEIVTTKVLSQDFSVYVQNASVTDKSLAPEGKSTIYLLVPVPNILGRIDWEREKQAFRDKVVRMVEARGFPGLSSHIEKEYIITPQDWQEKYAVYRGATFNLGHQIRQMLLFRPHNRFEDIDNCYLVGGGTHPGSGLPTIYESGRISAELIMGQK
jgi:phytoene desaturase